MFLQGDRYGTYGLKDDNFLNKSLKLHMFLEQFTLTTFQRILLLRWKSQEGTVRCIRLISKFVSSEVMILSQYGKISLGIIFSRCNEFKILRTFPDQRDTCTSGIKVKTT